MAIAMGYEDLNDHKTLLTNPALQIATGLAPEEDQPLGSPSTLSRLENRITRKELVEMNAPLVELFIESHDEAPEEIILDFDATDDPTHGNQERSFFHGYYDHHCFLPLYVFRGQQLLCAYLRPSRLDGATHAWAILSLLVKRFRLLLAVSCVGALLLVTAFALPVVRSDSPMGVVASAADLESVVSAGPGPATGSACTGTYLQRTWCLYQAGPPSYCANMNGTGRRGTQGCGGPTNSFCNGTPTEWAFFPSNLKCCQIQMGVCQPLQLPTPPHTIVQCNSVAPWTNTWFGTNYNCVTDGSYNYEG